MKVINWDNFRIDSIPGAERARMMIMFKYYNINNPRLTNIKEVHTTCMWFKMKNQQSTIVLSAWYHQRDHHEKIKHLNDDGVNGEVSRLESSKDKSKRQKTF